MCDEQTTRDVEEHLRKHGLTRREFGKSGAGAALALILPPVANAMDVVEEEVMVETPDGMADCYFVHPAEGRHAAVIGSRTGSWRTKKTSSANMDPPATSSACARSSAAAIASGACC